MKYTQALPAERVAVQRDVRHPLMRKSTAEIEEYVAEALASPEATKALLVQVVRTQRNILRRLSKMRT
jgi:hypothetical protein